MVVAFAGSMTVDSVGLPPLMVPGNPAGETRIDWARGALPGSNDGGASKVKPGDDCPWRDDNVMATVALYDHENHQARANRHRLRRRRRASLMSASASGPSRKGGGARGSLRLLSQLTQWS